MGREAGKVQRLKPVETSAVFKSGRTLLIPCNHYVCFASLDEKCLPPPGGQPAPSDNLPTHIHHPWLSDKVLLDPRWKWPTAGYSEIQICPLPAPKGSVTNAKCMEESQLAG